MGMPPATLASMARLMRAAMARSHSSAPARAISSLFAVTTDFPAAMAASMISRATVVPPISSATICISGFATTSRQSRGLHCGIEMWRKRLVMDAAAADCAHAQRETELERDLIRVLRENRERTRADVPQADDSDVDHFSLYDVWPRLLLYLTTTRNSITSTSASGVTWTSPRSKAASSCWYDAPV